MPKKVNELLDFRGKTVVVTGGAMGIGYGIVKRFAEAGANTVIADINEKIGSKKAQEIKKEYNMIKTIIFNFIFGAFLALANGWIAKNLEQKQ